MVGSFLANSLRNIWPFSIFESSDLKESKELVQRLSVPESTKNFVFAIRVPEHDSVIYLLATQNLSERSASDAECLIREIRPGAVVAQVDRSAFGEAQVEESVLGDGASDSIPTSAFRVLLQCFVDKVYKEKYESVAGILVLREIFGTSFNGHLLAAKRVAGEVGSSFKVLESPFVKIAAVGYSSGENETGGKMQGLGNSLVSQNAGSAIFSSSRRFLITNDVQEKMLKLLSSQMNQLGIGVSPSPSSVAGGICNEIQSDSHEIPPFAQSIYPFLVDLHDMFKDLPSIGKALTNARKMLSDVDRGKSMDAEVISEVYLFQIAVEGLRMAWNNAGRLPMGSSSRTQVQFSKLSSEEKSYAIMADLLRSQAKRFKNIVAVVDVSTLRGLRKHWKTCVPQEVKDMSEHMLQDFDNDEENKDSKLKRLISDKPVVAVGAGATAIWGASSLTKAISASPLFKIVTFKVPASLNLFITHTHKAMTFAFTKAGPSKVMAQGFASSGAKSTSLVKASLSAEKIRAVTHSIIASVEKTSFSAMRTAFYEIMRKRRAKPIGVLPLATFGLSLATCGGLLMCGDGIECAAVSLPSAPSIANLGRGIQNLHEASLEARRREGNRIQIAIESLRQRLKKVAFQ